MVTQSLFALVGPRAVIVLVLSLTVCQWSCTGSRNLEKAVDDLCGNSSQQTGCFQGSDVQVEEAIRGERERRGWVGAYRVENIKFDQMGGWSAIVIFIPEGPGAFATVHGSGTKIIRWRGGE